MRRLSPPASPTARAETFLERTARKNKEEAERRSAEIEKKKAEIEAAMARGDKERKEMLRVSKKGVENLRIQKEQREAEERKKREEIERRIREYEEKRLAEANAKKVKWDDLKQQLADVKESPQLSRPIPSVTQSIPAELRPRRLPYENPDVPPYEKEEEEEKKGLVGKLRRTINATRESTNNIPLRQEEEEAPLTPAEQAQRYDSEVWHRTRMIEGLSESDNQKSTENDDLDEELLTLTALKTQLTRTSSAEKIQDIYKKMTGEDLPAEIDSYSKIQEKIDSIKRILPKKFRPSTSYLGYYKGHGRFAERQWF